MDTKVQDKNLRAEWKVPNDVESDGLPQYKFKVKVENLGLETSWQSAALEVASYKLKEPYVIAKWTKSKDKDDLTGTREGSIAIKR